MSKAKRKGLVPKLRFTEFRNAGDWEEKQLGKVSDVRDGTHDSPKFYSTGKPLVTSKNLLSDGSLDLKNVSLISEKDYEQINQRSRVDVGDILFGMIGTIGNPVMIQFDGFAIKNVALIKQQNELLNRYLVQFLNSEYIAKKFGVLTSGNTQKFIALGKLRSLDVPVPPNQEQQKIADCLSSIDELISAQSQKVEALKTHKKGLMQQLFPREGETIPRLRFPEFRVAGEWDEVSFEKIIKINSGKSFKASEYTKKGIRLLQIENVGYGETKWNENTIYLPEAYITEYPELVLRNGDIVLALNRPVTNDELKIARILKDDEPSILYQRVGKLDVIGESLAVEFAFHICRQFIKEFVISKSIGSDQPFISLRDLYAQSILIPLPTEQQKIADCLSSIDELISAHSQKLDTLKTHKKGMMQQLFPSSNEQMDLNHG
jgi:type I restriction enzyme S subunit